MSKVNIINRSPYPLPEYQTENSAGLDLRAVLDETLELKPLERSLIKTG